MVVAQELPLTPDETLTKLSRRNAGSGILSGVPTAYRRRVCGHCSAPLTQPTSGRPRRWCSGSCRQAAYAQRQRRKSPRNDWYTPEPLRSEVQRRWPLVLDAAATAQSKLAEAYLGLDHHDPDRRDALAYADWHSLAVDAGGGVVWLNPPYLPAKLLDAFLVRAVVTAAAGTSVVGLVPASTGTRWWWTHIVDAGAHVEFLRGRLSFTGPYAEPTGGAVAPWACALVEWRGAL